MNLERIQENPSDDRTDRVDLLVDLSSRLRSGTNDDIKRALELAASCFDMKLGIIGRVEGDAFFVEHLHRGVQVDLDEGQRLDLAKTFCSIALAAGDVVTIDSMNASEYRDHPCYQDLRLESYIGVPLRVDGELHGTLSFSALTPKPSPWNERDRRLLRLIARWVESSILRQRLTDRLDRALLSLEHANMALNEKNKDLNAFVSAASHDLKEPLRNIAVLVGFLRTDLPQLSVQTEENLTLIEQTSKRGLCLIADLLDYTRVSSHEDRIERIDLTDLAEKVVEDLQQEITRTNGVVTIGKLPEAWTDRVQVRQLLNNLIGNALKYHCPGVPPEVLVEGFRSSELGDDEIELRILDNGIGFDEEQAEQIFQPFHRLHGRELYEGTGLGLAICARIVERLGGAITAQSERGYGSTFIVRLPSRRRGAQPGPEQAA